MKEATHVRHVQVKGNAKGITVNSRLPGELALWSAAQRFRLALNERSYPTLMVCSVVQILQYNYHFFELKKNDVVKRIYQAHVTFKIQLLDQNLEKFWSNFERN